MSRLCGARRVTDGPGLATQSHVSRETCEKLECYVALLSEENERQNLVSSRHARAVWDRHIIDSAQLLVTSPSRIFLGRYRIRRRLPGVVIGCLTERSR